jgi:hypothetical protein
LPRREDRVTSFWMNSSSRRLGVRPYFAIHDATAAGSSSRIVTVREE